MTVSETVAKGVNYRQPFTTYSASKDPVAPDSAPSISIIHKNGVATTISGAAISQRQDSTPANITGYYELVVPTSTLAISDQVDVRVTATIAGKVCFNTYSFTVVDGTGSLPFID